MAEVTKGPQNVNISAFRERLRGGGARPNLYEVVLNLPNGLDFADASGVQDKSRFLVKAAALPASNLGVVEVPYRGRQLKVAGDRTFDTWTVTVLNDTDFKVRSAMEAWTNQINNNYTNIGVQNPDTYQQDAFVYQLDREERVFSQLTYHRLILHLTLTIQLKSSQLNSKFSGGKHKQENWVVKQSQELTSRT